MKKSLVIIVGLFLLTLILISLQISITGDVISTDGSELKTEVFYSSSHFSIKDVLHKGIEEPVVLPVEEVVLDETSVVESTNTTVANNTTIVKPVIKVPTGPKKKIASIEEEITIGSTSGMSRPSIAVDSKNQSHIVTNKDDSKGIYIYHQINGKWSESKFASPGGNYDAGRMYMPHIEIDSKDRAWISCKFGAKEWGSMLGQGLWVVSNVAKNPSSPAFRWIKESETHKGNGNIGLDTNSPDEGIMMGSLGNWAKFKFVNGKIEKTDSGNMNAGSSGEKIRFEISPRSKQSGVWHTVFNGWSQQASSYQNSIGAANGDSPIVWASHSTYPEQGSDFSHPSIGIDFKKPQVAYIASGFSNDVFVNIWDGSKMLYSSNNLLTVDTNTAQNGNGELRYAPQWAPAKGGGTFLCWTGGGNKIRLRYIDSSGFMGVVKEIGSGSNCAIATDDNGNIHMTYVNGVMKYRKIVTNY
jgi:hypothetical protein